MLYLPAGLMNYILVTSTTLSTKKKKTQKKDPKPKTSFAVYSVEYSA